MPTIAMTREMGSLGKDVVESLAAELGMRIVYSEIVDSLAEKMQMPPSVVTRFVQGKSNAFERIRVDMDALSLHTAEEVLALVAQGNVAIRGWGATYLLRPAPHVACVRICAPFELRVARMMERMETSDADFAREEIRRSDAAHTAAMQRRFGVDWKDPEHYDLVLNTGRLSVEDCVGQIKYLLALPAYQETADSRTVLANLALSAHVLAALKRNTRTTRVNIIVDAARNAHLGHLILRGIVADDGIRSAVEETAASYPGVRIVENQLKLMTVHRVPKSHDG